MKKKVLLDEIYVLDEFFKVILENKFKMSLAFKLDMLKDEIRPHADRVEKFKNELIQKYGEVDKENSQMIRLKEENAFLFRQEFAELLVQEVEIDTFDVTLEDLDHIEIQLKFFGALKRLLAKPVEEAVEVE